MCTIALIPARLESTRLKNKLMEDLCGKPVIQRTYDRVKETNLFHKVYVVTDSDIIHNQIVRNGGDAIMSKMNHVSGSDRIAEAAMHLEAELIINIQGDEPFITKEPLQKLKEIFSLDDEKRIQVASIMQRIHKQEDAENPNIVKVVVDKMGDSLLFSRLPIPYQREKSIENTHFRHIGVYAFRKDALIAFSRMEETKLEKLEKLENLRLLENGIKIRMIEVEFDGIGIDTISDLEDARIRLGKL